jgi:hypothetical protein
MHTAATEGIEIDGEGSDQGLALAGFHFGNLAVVQHHAANQLHIEMAHVEDSPASFAHHRECFHQDVIEYFLEGLVFLFFELFLLVEVGIDFRLGGAGLVWRTLGKAAQPLLDALPEHVGLGEQFGIGQLLDFGLKRIDGVHLRHQ